MIVPNVVVSKKVIGESKTPCVIASFRFLEAYRCQYLYYILEVNPDEPGGNKEQEGKTFALQPRQPNLVPK
jgi:hypothetical protein